MRSRLSLFLAGLLPFGVAATGCGDDDPNPGNPDAANGDDADAAPDDPDAAPPFVADYDSAEGGEVRLEYLQWAPGAGPGGRTTSTRVTSFFMKSMTPDAFPAVSTMGFGCFNVSGDTMWPTAQAADRVYINAGNVVITPTTGGGGQMVVGTGSATPVVGTDALLRNHASGGTNYLHFTFGTDNGGELTPDTAYSVLLTGSDEWPSQAFNDVLFMPASWTVGTPGLVGPLVFTRGVDTAVTWVPATSANLPAGYEVIHAFAFVGPPTGVAAVCLTEDDGVFTIPGTTVGEVMDAGQTGGFFSNATLTHVVKELNNGSDVSERRIDFISIWCYLTAVSFAEPP